MGLYSTALTILASTFSLRKPVPPLGVSNPGEYPRLKAGFYVVEGKGGHFFLGPQKYLETDWRGTARRLFEGVRGAFLPDGVIGGRVSARGLSHYAEFNGARVAVRLVGEGADGVRILFPSGEIVARYATRSIAQDVLPTTHLAHRGSHYLAPPPVNPDGLFPSNTMGAFEDALEAGYEGIEADVRITADGQFAVYHDRSLRSATDGRGDIRETAWEDVRRLAVAGTATLPEYRIGLLKAPFGAGVSPLAEVLGRFLPDERVKRLVVDVKPDVPERIAAAAERVFPAFAPELRSKLIILCELPEGLAAARRVAPESRFALEGKKGNEPLKDIATFVPEAAGRPRGAHDAVSINLALPLASFRRRAERIRELLRTARRFGYETVGWTLSTSRELDLVRREGLHTDVLLSDAPYWRIALQRLKAASAVQR